MVITQENLRKFGVIIFVATAVYAMPWTHGILSILDKSIFGTITGIHIVSALSGYFAYRVWYRNL